MNNEKLIGLKKFFENIWYHYKYVILIVLAALIMFSVATCQSVNKKNPDVFIYHISTQGLTAASKDNFRSSMAHIAEDYNGDGAVTVDFKEEVYTPSLDTVKAYGEMSVTESFNLELALGECIIYIMDKSFYDGNKQYMADLDSVLDVTPPYAYENKALLLSEIPLYKSIPGLSDFLPESYICLREKRSGMNEENYNNHIDFLKKFVKYISER